MTKSSPEHKRVGVITALVVTGLSIGWLAGLAVSPVKRNMNSRTNCSR